MKVSIITATFNRERSIVRALKSIKNQTYSDIESIIIDGDSEDNTINLIKPILDTNDVLISEPDDGIYDALNKGLSNAKGDIIGFLHSDDTFFNEDVINQVVKSFNRHDADIVYGDSIFFPKSNFNKVIRRYRSGTFSKKNLAWGKMPSHPALFIKRHIYEEIGYFKTDYKIAGDYEFLCRLIKYPNLKKIHLKQIFVKQQLGGASTKGIRNTILLNQETLKALKTNNIYSNLFMLLSKYPSKIMEFIIK